MMLPKEYRTISNLSGPLMMVDKIEDVSYDELAEIRLGSGERRRGRVLEISKTKPLSRSTKEAPESTSTQHRSGSSAMS